MKAPAISNVCLVVLVLAGLGVWGFTSWQNHSAVNLAVGAQLRAGEATVAAGQAKVDQAAQTIVVQGQARDRTDNQVHEQNVQAIAAAPGAGALVGPDLIAALDAGLCRHPAESADPRCPGLLAGDPAVIPQAGPGDAAPPP